MTGSFWNNKRVLITGHTGFKGSWLSLWLAQLGAELVGLSTDPPTRPSLYEQARVASSITSLRGNICDLHCLDTVFQQHQPEIVFHCAAQSLVRYSYHHPVETYASNVMGTLNVLEAIRRCPSVQSAVMLTSDKCYRNRETSEGYREGDPLGGLDLYSSSKGCAELLIASYRESYFPATEYQHHSTAIASARAGNVIGGGDWAQDRLVPDILCAFAQGKSAELRNPRSIRPWQHVLAPLSGYMLLAEQLYREGSSWAEAWNFGPGEHEEKSVQWIVEEISRLWGSNTNWRVTVETQLAEASLLRLDSTKANTRLGWQSAWNLQQALQKTVAWHQALANTSDPRELCIRQIEEYTNASA